VRGRPLLLLRAQDFLLHQPGPGHPESPRRLQAVYAALDAGALPAGVVVEAPPAAPWPALERVHEPRYLERIAATAGQARTVLDPDTVTSPHSYACARRAAGAALRAVEAVVDGEARHAFGLVRPPGHHALPDRAMGFCLFNNVAVAAAHAQAELGCHRVLILDLDVHHGNGTQAVFWERADVLFVSSHQHPFWPGSGALEEIGAGPGRGRTVNLPLPAGSGDAEYLYVYREVVEPLVDAFRPDLVLVSAGFDTWQHDPLGGMRLTTAGYRALYGLFRAWTERHCPGRLVAVLEGGYDPAGMARVVPAVLEVLAAAAPAPAPDLPPPPGEAVEVAARARELLAPCW